MEKDFLEECLAKGMSLPQIGELSGRPASTVGYWVAKHGLVANGRAKFSPGKGKRMSREDLERLVLEGRSISQIGDELEVGSNCVRYWIDRFDLPSPREVRRTLANHALQTGDRASTRWCAIHGDTEFILDKKGSWRCRTCRSQRVADRRRKVKRILVDEAGGSCCVCGYNRSVAALHFHHVDPRTKRFSVSRAGYTRGIAEMRTEAQKCVLLCANCHAEVESGETELPTISLRSETPRPGLEPGNRH